MTLKQAYFFSTHSIHSTFTQFYLLVNENKNIYLLFYFTQMLFGNKNVLSTCTYSFQGGFQSTRTFDFTRFECTLLTLPISVGYGVLVVDATRVSIM